MERSLAGRVAVQAAVAGFYAKLLAATRAAAGRFCEECPNATNGKTSASATGRDLTNVTSSPGLFSVGRSIFFEIGECAISVDCRNGGYSYDCNAAFGIEDSFKDPLDLEEKGWLQNGELPFSQKYPIEYVFERAFGGHSP